MYSNDYAKELSDHPVEKGIPTVVAVLIFVLLGGAVWYGYGLLKDYSKSGPPPPIEVKK